jgi:hypothetical protein
MMFVVFVVVCVSLFVSLVSKSEPFRVNAGVAIVPKKVVLKLSYICDVAVVFNTDISFSSVINLVSRLRLFRLMIGAARAESISVTPLVYDCA